MQEVCATIKNFVDKGIVALTLLHTDIGDCWNSYVCLVQFCEVLVVAFALYWLDDYMIEIQGLYDTNLLYECCVLCLYV